MKIFQNKTITGNEKALRKGKVVPVDDINLAYFQSPSLSPAENVVVIDTSQTIAGNIGGDERSISIMYSNAVGVLEDINGNQIIKDEYPIVGDVFSVDEDFSLVPNTSEYVPESFLPFVHSSRYFHLDYAGLTSGTEPRDYVSDRIKVLDQYGKEYLDENGQRKYRIQIAPASSLFQIAYPKHWAYRVFAYIDDDTNENLYLTYNKIEINLTRNFVNQVSDYQELLNPVPYFTYQPEESLVVDPLNKKEKWFSTKSISEKNKLLHNTDASVDGYKIYAPKKAIADPRIFQLFRWRIVCDMVKSYTLDSTNPNTIRVGVITTRSSRNSLTPFVFYNLERSNININGLSFVNPLSEEAGLDDKTQASYWYVDFDTVTNEQLAKFDILLWAPNASISLTPYISKYHYFTLTLGKTIFFDTNNLFRPTGFWGFSNALTPWNGTPRTRTGKTIDARFDKIVWYPTIESSRPGPPVFVRQHPNEVFFGLDSLGGWDIDMTPGDNEVQSLTYSKFLWPDGHCQVFPRQGGSYRSLISFELLDARAPTGPGGPGRSGTLYDLLSWAELPNAGNIFVSTMGQSYSVNALWNYTTKRLISHNSGSEIASTTLYDQYINTPIVEGAAKLLYNICLIAIRGKLIHEQDKGQHSNSWTVASDWKTSWVIDPDDDVLSQNEIQQYDFILKSKDLDQPELVWQRQLSKSTLKEIIDAELTDAQKAALNGATRTYRIETTNGSAVTVPLLIGDDSYPYAWTKAFSPKFVIPPDLGPHIIKEELVHGSYPPIDYVYKEYPQKPFTCQASVTGIKSTDAFNPQTVFYTAVGTATETYKVTVTDPPTPGYASVEEVAWNIDQFSAGANNPYKNVSSPNGISFLQEYHYYESHTTGAPTQNWVFWGLSDRYSSSTNPSGEVVMFIQDVLNRLQFFGVFSLPGSVPLRLTGRFDRATSAGVVAFQQSIGARYIDGVVDAETWSLLGGQILRFKGFIQPNPNDFTKYYQWAFDRVPKTNLSDLNSATQRSFTKRSWTRNGPTYISESFILQLEKPYSVVGVKLTPFCESGPSMIIEGLDVFRNMSLAQKLSYNVGTALLRGPWTVKNNSPLILPISPHTADTVVLTLGQNQPCFSGNNSARVIGVRDLTVLAKVQVPGKPGKTRSVNATRQVAVHATGSVNLTSEKPVSIKVRLTDSRKLSNIKWTGVTIAPDDGSVSVAINQSGTITLRPSGMTHAIDTGDGSQYVLGPKIGAGVSTGEQYFSMSTDKRLNTMPEIGYVSHNDGIKLLCKSDLTPYGLEPIAASSFLPSDLSDTGAVHFASMRLNVYDTDPLVRVGFYDIQKQEFIVNAAGEPAMAWIDYISRGPNNVYIGVYSDIEAYTKAYIPDDDATLLPLRWAMPVYGVLARKSYSIKLEPLTANFDQHNVWPIAVKTGRFDRREYIKPINQGPLTNYLNRYQGSYVHAFYSVPESSLGNWSTIYGPPFIDVKGEAPIIMDDDLIKVRQTPLHVQKEPTQWSLPSDPVRPCFTVFVRDTIDDPWTELTLGDIKDYNVSNGEIFLKTPLKSLDNNLVKVDYVSERHTYYFKGNKKDGHIDLNPNHQYSSDFLGKAIYIYLVPQYVLDESGNLIADSVTDRCIRFTTDVSIFNSLQPDFNPLIVQIGIVYITTAVDIDKLALIDTRSRGGGIEAKYTLAEASRLLGESVNNWDINYANGLAYQRGGYIIIRLPKELKDYFTETDIRSVIDRNITSGVWYDIEDSEGNSWDVV